jgi:uncharacterized protein (DUF4415 family)
MDAKESDFSDAKPATEVEHLNRLRAEKTRITIYLDSDVIESFRVQADQQGRGYQTLINEALRVHLNKAVIATDEATLRRVIREELQESA